MILKIKTDKPNNWVDFTKDVSFELGYLTQAQDKFLQDLLYGQMDKEETKAIAANVSLWQYTIKFKIKNWKGITDENGKPIECKLADYGRGLELEDDLWWSLVRIDRDNLAESQAGLLKLYQFIEGKTEFTESDKKK